MAQEPLMFNEAQLDRPCEPCEGTGRAGDRTARCRTCEGTGFTLTRDGEALLAFLERHLRLRESA